MRKVLFLVSMCWVVGYSYADDSSFKNQTLDDYVKRCVDVLSSKGFDDQTIENECACERKVIDSNFSTFELMMAAGKGLVGKELIDKEKMSEIKKMLKACKNEHLLKKG